jgi:hypothetical protein
VKIEILTATNVRMKMVVVWDVALCSLVNLIDVSEVLSATIILFLNVSSY